MADNQSSRMFNPETTPALTGSLKVLFDLALQSGNVDLQNYVLEMTHDFRIIDQLKKWSDDILRSDQDSPALLVALQNLREVGTLVFKNPGNSFTVHDREIEPDQTHRDMSTQEPRTNRKAPTFDIILTSPRSRPLNPVTGEPFPPITLLDADLLANSSNLNAYDAPHRRTPRIVITPADADETVSLAPCLRPSAPQVRISETKSAKDTESDEDEPAMIGPFYVLTKKDAEKAGGSTKMLYEISAAMDRDEYWDSVMKFEAEAAEKKNGEDIDSDYPPSIKALFDTSPDFAQSVWKSSPHVAQDPSAKTFEDKFPPNARKDPPASIQTGATPNGIARRTPLAANDGMVSGVFSPTPVTPDHMGFELPEFTISSPNPDVVAAYKAWNPAPEKEVALLTPSRFTPRGQNPRPRVTSALHQPARHVNRSEHEEDIDLEAFRALMRKKAEESRYEYTIPQSHPDPVVNAELAALRAQTILPSGYNKAYKNICPCELRSMICPFRIQCTLKRCYNPDEHHLESSDMHPSIRPTCLPWIAGKNCGHNLEEMMNGKFGHDDGGTRALQGSDDRIRLHLALNI